MSRHLGRSQRNRQFQDEDGQAGGQAGGQGGAEGEGPRGQGDEQGGAGGQNGGNRDWRGESGSQRGQSGSQQGGAQGGDEGSSLRRSSGRGSGSGSQQGLSGGSGSQQQGGKFPPGSIIIWTSLGLFLAMIFAIIIWCFCCRRNKQQYYGHQDGAPTVTPLGVTGQPVVGAFHSGAYGAPQMLPPQGQIGGQFGNVGQSGFGGQPGQFRQPGFR